jgi:hypothetical protein
MMIIIYLPKMSFSWRHPPPFQEAFRPTFWIFLHQRYVSRSSHICGQVFDSGSDRWEKSVRQPEVQLWSQVLRVLVVPSHFFALPSVRKCLLTAVRESEPLSHELPTDQSHDAWDHKLKDCVSRVGGGGITLMARQWNEAVTSPHFTSPSESNNG